MTASPKRILVAPLDWGLGHATRCIPLICGLQQLGCEVVIAAEGQQADLLAREFPDLEILPLQGYGIRYASAGSRFGLRMLLQLPQIRKAVRRENRWLKKTAETHRINAVISDNRLGLHHPGIPCVILTHQLRIRSPFGRRTEQWLQAVNYHYIEKFSACWVVDYPGPENLAGELSHPQKLPGTEVRYLGALSRFRYQPVSGPRAGILILISGPEPQRSLLEELAVRQAATLDEQVLIVSGQPSVPRDERISSSVRLVNHLPSAELNRAILGSRRIVCRSGYSSIMDLAGLGRTAILVPTPGQTEQEYLAGYLMKKGYFMSVVQERLDLRTALQEAEQFPFRPFRTPAQDSGRVLEEFAAGL